MTDKKDDKNEVDPNENNLDDQVLIDSPGKLVHEDQVPATQQELDAEAENDNLREGSDIDGGKTARELLNEREEAAEDD